MERVISKNQWRTEENKDMFDYFEGKFVVSYNGWNHFFTYTGSNVRESLQNRSFAKKQARSWFDTFKPFYTDIKMIENNL